MPGVGLMGGLGSSGLEFKSCLAVELIPGGIDSACHPSEVGKMSPTLLEYCVGVATGPGLWPIAKETALAAPTLCTEYGPDVWMGVGVCSCKLSSINAFKATQHQALVSCVQFGMDFKLHIPPYGVLAFSMITSK